MSLHQRETRPDDADVRRALRPLHDRPTGLAALMADDSNGWSVYPVKVGPINGEFRKTLRVRTMEGDAFDFSAEFGFDASTPHPIYGVRNVHRPTDGESPRSKLVSFDMLLDLSGIGRTSDSVSRRVLQFIAPHRMGLWELPGAHARVFIDPITLIEQFVTPKPELASLLLSPFMGSTYETVIDGDLFVFRSSSKVIGDFVGRANLNFPRSNFGSARCLAYWLGSQRRARELDKLVTSLLDAQAPLTLPRMFGKVPVRLICVAEGTHYIVLQMHSLIHGAYWPPTFDRIRLEDTDSGLALEFSEQEGDTATLMWWGPCNVEVRPARCIAPAVVSPREARPSRLRKRHEGDEMFWPTLLHQGANRTAFLTNGEFSPAPRTRGDLPPLRQPLRYGASDGRPLHHRERVLRILRSWPGPRTIAQMLSAESLPAGRGVRFTQSVDGPHPKEAARLRLLKALEQTADSSDWKHKLAKRFDVSLPVMTHWLDELGRNPTPNRTPGRNRGAPPDIQVIEPLFQDSLPIETIDALRALRLRGAMAYGFAKDRWTSQRLCLLAWAVGIAQLTAREMRLCTRSTAPCLEDNELLKILRLAGEGIPAGSIRPV